MEIAAFLGHLESIVIPHQNLKNSPPLLVSDIRKKRSVVVTTVILPNFPVMS